jgi:transcriptional regulator with XRE-family HTH domain
MGRSRKNDPPDISTPGGRIKKVRLDAGLTQAQFGERIPISQSRIVEWEQGNAEPDLPQYRIIARVTNTDLVWLLIGGDPTNSNALSALAAGAQKQNRYFAWTLVETARFFTEEGVKPNISVLISYVQKFLAAADNSPDDASAHKAIFGEIETERAILRKSIDDAIKKRI